jgi:ATP-dependent DNA ligase
VESTQVPVRPPLDVTRPTTARALPSTTARGPLQYEIKLDGWRAVGGRMEDRAVLYSRQGGNLAVGFPEVIEALKQFPVGTVVDGELCAFVGGKMDFGALAHRRGRNRAKWPPIAFVLFDMLATTGEDLRPLPLEERWELLGALLEEPLPPLQRVLATRDREEAAYWLEHLLPMGVEGIIAKPLRLPYGPRARWVKVKHTETLDVPIVAVIGHPARPEHVVVQMPDGPTAETNKLVPADRAAVGRAVAGHLADPDARGRRRVFGQVIAEVVTDTGRHASVRFLRVRDDLMP